MDTQFTNSNSVRNLLVIPALGSFVEDFDIDAITSDLIIGMDDQQNLILNDEEFWTIAERHAL